jgi:hypothetical protein
MATEMPEWLSQMFRLVPEQKQFYFSLDTGRPVVDEEKITEAAVMTDLDAQRLLQHSRMAREAAEWLNFTRLVCGTEPGQRHPPQEVHDALSAFLDAQDGADVARAEAGRLQQEYHREQIQKLMGIRGPL